MDEVSKEESYPNKNNHGELLTFERVSKKKNNIQD